MCKGGKVNAAEWQVTLCDQIWHVISRSGVVIFIPVYLLYKVFIYYSNFSCTEYSNPVLERISALE